MENDHTCNTINPTEQLEAVDNFSVIICIKCGGIDEEVDHYNWDKMRYLCG